VMAVHFIGFVENSQQYQNAVRAFGPPAFVHRVWDVRAKFGGEFDPDNDVRVFAKGTDADPPSAYSFNDSEMV
jgi:hypothetical protein